MDSLSSSSDDSDTDPILPPPAKERNPSTPLGLQNATRPSFDAGENTGGARKSKYGMRDRDPFEEFSNVSNILEYYERAQAVQSQSAGAGSAGGAGGCGNHNHKGTVVSAAARMNGPAGSAPPSLSPHDSISNVNG